MLGLKFTIHGIKVIRLEPIQLRKTAGGRINSPGGHSLHERAQRVVFAAVRRGVLVDAGASLAIASHNKDTVGGFVDSRGHARHPNAGFPSVLHGIVKGLRGRGSGCRLHGLHVGDADASRLADGHQIATEERYVSNTPVNR